MGERKKQKPKKGKVIRVDQATWNLLSTKRLQGETVVSAVHRLLTAALKRGRVYYILPESGLVCDSIADAKGKAIMASVKSGKKKPIESPVKVYEAP